MKVDEVGPSQAGKVNQILTKERQRQRGSDTQGQGSDRQTEAERDRESYVNYLHPASQHPS